MIRSQLIITLLTQGLVGNHMECSACGQHWCWYCGEKSSEAEIYAHMESEHGGYYAGGDEYLTDVEGNESDY